MRLPIENGQYWISDHDPGLEFVLPGTVGASGLVGVSSGMAIVITGTQSGDVDLTVKAGEKDPGLDTGPWDDVTEISLSSGPGAPGVSVTSGGHGPDELQYLTPPGAGSYRVRVHARGRDAGAPVEEHLIQIWPAPPAPATIHKSTDQVGTS